jgi:integrase
VGKTRNTRKIKRNKRIPQNGESYHSKKLLVNHLIKRFGNLKVKCLDTKMIEKWQSEQLKSNKPATVNRKLTVLKHMIRKGVKWRMASKGILEDLREEVKQLKEENTRLRFLNIEECRTLTDCCVEHLRPIVTVALHTGMRLSEILKLKWDQVDLRHGFILLEITKNGERREIPIDNMLKEMFNSMPYSVESIYVFTDPKTGEPYKTIKRSFGTALKKAGIRDFRFHDLRHTFASQMVMAGVDLISLKDLLGHKSLSMTMRYAHLAPGHKRKAVNMLDNVLSAQDKNTKKEAPLHSFSSQFGQNPDFIHLSPYAPVAQKDRATVS